MRLSIRMMVAGFVLLSTGAAWVGAQQPHDRGDTQKESTAGKIAWQYDTGG